MLSTTPPDIFFEEIPAGINPIAGVETSITSFVGRASRGPVDRATTICGFDEFERVFGGLRHDSALGYAVYHYFLNGGASAIVVRVHKGATAARIVLEAQGSPALTLAGRDPGAWTNRLTAHVSHGGDSAQSDSGAFELTVRERADASPTAPILREEIFRDVSLDPASPRYVVSMLEAESMLVVVDIRGDLPAIRPSETPLLAHDVSADGTGSDGIPIDDAVILGEPDDGTGLHALESVDLFNILCIPPLRRQAADGAGADGAGADGAGADGADLSTDTWKAAAEYCAARRAILIVDPPETWRTAADVVEGLDAGGIRSESAMLCFPRIEAPDPLGDGAIERFAACGAIAGVIARTDRERGIWRAPAGLSARLRGVRGPAVELTQDDLGLLNPTGANAIRLLPDGDSIVWGSRTLMGADRIFSTWKYLPVRRMALHIEESLRRGIRWDLLESDSELLRRLIRSDVEVFMHDLFIRGAFQGARPEEAYFVECGEDAAVQCDVGGDAIGIVVGFAPIKPAEFVVVRIQQISGTITA